MLHTDANEVIIVTGVFDQASLPIASFLIFIPLIPRIYMYFTSASILPILLATTSLSTPGRSLHITCKPDCLEALPVFIPWRDKMAYKFIVNGRWMTNDVEPTEVDPSFIVYVYTAPPKPILP